VKISAIFSSFAAGNKMPYNISIYLLNCLSGLLFWGNHESKVCRGKKVRKAFRTRWLSRSNAVDGVYEDFVPIIQAINLADEKDGLTTYLLSKMKSFKFIGTIYILKAVLPELAALSRAYPTSYHLHY